MTNLEFSHFGPYLGQPGPEAEPWIKLFGN